MVFLNDFKHYCKGNKNLIDTSIFDINFYDGNEPNFLQSNDLLDLFIHKNFFYLDYFNILVNDLKSEPFPPLYDLSNYNCTTFALEKLNHIGIVIPAQPTISLDAPAPCHVEGFAPGAVGQFLRNEYQLPAGAFKNLNGGITPESTNCQ